MAKANLSSFISIIKTAVYGRDMRSAIANAFSVLRDLTSLELDDSLKEEGYAADSKAVGDILFPLKSQVDAIIPGLTRTEKNALLAFFQALAGENPSLITLYKGVRDLWNTPVENIILDRETESIGIGMKITLIPTFVPEDAYDKTVSWESSVPSVATVDQTGVVTGLLDGTTIITVKGGDEMSISDTCSITVDSSIVYYSITWILTDTISSNRDAYVKSNQSLYAILSAEKDTDYVYEAIVKMGGVDITSTCYNEETGEISISAVTGNLEITAKSALSATYTIEYSLSGCEIDNEASTITHAKKFVAIITPDESTYEYGELTIIMGGSDITDTAVSDGENNTKLITINYVSGNITITAKAGRFLMNKSIGFTFMFPAGTSNAQFMVVHKGNPDPDIYDESCDGVWCMMVTTTSEKLASAGGGGVYPQTNIHEYLQTTLYSQIPEGYATLIKTVKLPYYSYASKQTVSGSDGCVANIFAPGFFELGGNNGGIRDDLAGLDGAVWDYFKDAPGTATDLRAAYTPDGDAANYWTRGIWKNQGSDYVNAVVFDNGNFIGAGPNQQTNKVYLRPCMILSNTTSLNEDGAIIPESVTGE